MFNIHGKLFLLIILLFDEMKIKSGLVYSKSSWTGFTDLGELNEFERAINGVNQEQKLESHVLFVMAEGLFKSIILLVTSALVDLIVPNLFHFCGIQLLY